MLSSFWGKPQQTPPPAPVEEPKPQPRFVLCVETPNGVEEVGSVQDGKDAPPEEVSPIPLAPGEKLVLLGVKVHPDTKKRLGELASVAGMPVSAYVRNVLESSTR